MVFDKKFCQISAVSSQENCFEIVVCMVHSILAQGESS